MNLFKYFFGGPPPRNPGGPDHVVAPSTQFPSQVDALSALIHEIREDHWATFTAFHSGREIVVETTPHQINTCNEAVNVQALCREIGLTMLAETIQSDDHTLHDLPGASPRELAEVVHAIFRLHFELPANYRIEGSLSC